MTPGTLAAVISKLKIDQNTRITVITSNGIFDGFVESIGAALYMRDAAHRWNIAVSVEEIESITVTVEPPEEKPNAIPY